MSELLQASTPKSLSEPSATGNTDTKERAAVHDNPVTIERAAFRENTT